MKGNFGSLACQSSFFISFNAVINIMCQKVFPAAATYPQVTNIKEDQNTRFIRKYFLKVKVIYTFSFYYQLKKVFSSRIFFSPIYL